MSVSSFEGSIEGKAGWWTSIFFYMSKTHDLNWEEGGFSNWGTSYSILKTRHNTRNALQGQRMVCLCSLRAMRQQEMLFGERPASPATSCGASPSHFPTAMVISWRTSGGMSLPVTFRTCLRSCFLRICLTPFRTCCRCFPPLPPMAANSQSLPSAVQINILPLLGPFSNSYNKFPLMLLLENWWLAISTSSHAPYPLSSWGSQSPPPLSLLLCSLKRHNLFQSLFVRQFSFCSNPLALQQKLLGLVSRQISWQYSKWILKTITAMKTWLKCLWPKPAVPLPLKVISGGRRTVWANWFLLRFTVGNGS